MTRLSLAGVLAGLLWLAACNPTFNWRAVPADGAALQALMPCKPERAEREVSWGGPPAALHMMSCEAGGLTFAVAWVDAGEAARAAPALAAWRRATLAAVRADPALADAADARWPAALAGADAVQGLQAQGSDHRGQAIAVRALHAARGARLYHAAIYGPRIPPEVAAGFFEGLQLP